MAMLWAWLHSAADANVPGRSLRAGLHELVALIADDPRLDGGRPLESYVAHLQLQAVAASPFEHRGHCGPALVETGK